MNVHTLNRVRGLIIAAAAWLIAAPGLAGPANPIAAGGQHTCAVSSSGAMLCWGSNFYGQLGDGTTTTRLTPVGVSGLATGGSGLAAGLGHTCVLTIGGGASCWGDNASGQLGDGTTTVRRTPAPVSGLPGGVTAVATGDLHNCALTGGGVSCWGDNRFGQLGDGTTTNRLSPVAVIGLSSGVTAIATGDSHSCAVNSAGGVLCWGNNAAGELGDGTTTDRTTPVAVSGVSSGITAVTGGFRHTCALTAGGGVSCWGSNSSGQVGDGTTTQRTTPVPVTGLPAGVIAVAAGDFHSCAMTSASGVWCWGSNASGQVGDGATTNRLTPVSVNLGPGPFMSADRTSLNFAAVSNGTTFTAQTASQTVRLTQTGSGTVTWTATSTRPWLVVSPTSGTGSATLTIRTEFAAGLAPTQTGTIALAFTGSNSTAGPINVALTVVSSTAVVSPPFGVLDTPAGDGTVLAGSIAVTGWTLDNIGVQRTELWRDLQPGEPTPPFTSTPSDPRNGKIFIANATPVDGARPDVEGLYPTTPLNYRAGWGYLLLTWGLWNQGNGTYNLYAYAFDQENNIGTIGKKTIVISNNTATKPFGSIDTPEIGGNAFGPNFGWGLTPKVNGAATCKIQPSGVQVSIDSGPLQPVVYGGDVRTDVAGTFPGFSNSAAAGGHFIIDWATLTNGSHTIGWLLTDDCSRADGVGSRFFNVTGGTSLTATEAPLATAGPSSLVAASRASETESHDPITVARGYGELPEIVGPGTTGSRMVEMKQGERIEVRLPHGFESAYQLGPGGQRRALPAGSTWDADSQAFYWQPAPGFLGRFRLVFSNGAERISVRVVITP